MGGIKESFAAGTYPQHPGYREPTTSRDAAALIAKRSDMLRDRALTALRNVGERGLSSDEIASRIGEHINSVRPRITELQYANKIEKTGERRANASGAKAAVWRARL